MAVHVDPIDHEIGERLRLVRERRGVTLTGLTRAVGADPLELGRYEAGGAQVNWREALDDLVRAGADGSVEVVSAFLAIPDERVRRAFLDMAWTIVDAQRRSEPDS